MEEKGEWKNRRDGGGEMRWERRRVVGERRENSEIRVREED